MSDQTQEFALTPSVEQKLKKRTRPTLIPHDKKGVVPSDGRWHPDLVADYLRDHGGRERWVEIGTLAGVFYALNTASNRERVRRRIFRVCQILLDQNILLVIETGKKGATQAAKIYNPRSPEERQYLHARLERMSKQRLIKTAQLQKAIQLAECLDIP